MELGIIPTLAYLGSNINISNDNTDDIDYKYEKVDFIYNNDRSDVINNVIESKKDNIALSENPESTNIFNNRIKSINKIFPIYKDMSFKFYEDNVSKLSDSNLFESFDNNLQSSNLNYEDQFKPLTYQKDDKPPIAKNSHSSISKINTNEKKMLLTNEYSLFNKEEDDMTYGVVEKDQLKHSNMVPHFSQRGMINEYNDQNYSHKANIFSGSSKEYVPKAELLKENFTPLERDVNLVNGSRNNLGFMQSYYIPSTEKRNEMPFEQINVGPGLNLNPDQTSRPDGGNQEEWRPIPRSTDQLRSADRPKLSYKGILKSGQKGNKLGVLGDVFKRRPEKTVEIKTENYVKTGGEHKEQRARSKIELRKTERKDSRPVIGPARASDEKLTKKNTGKVSEPFKTETLSSGPSNVQEYIKKHNQNKCSYKLPENSRDLNPKGNLVAHPRRFSFGNLKFDPHDLPRQTIKQTTTFNEQSGHAKGVDEGKVKSYNPTDPAKVTRRELITNTEQSGHVRGAETFVQSFDPNDISRITLRDETQFYDQAGYAKGIENRSSAFNPNDITRTTLRDDTQFNEQAGYAKGVENRSTAYDPNDITRNTLRDDTQFNEQAGYAKGIENRSSAYDPDDILRHTQREDIQYAEQSGIVKGLENKIPVYDPNDILNETLRGQNPYNEQSGIAKGIENRNKAFDPDNLPSATLRETYSDATMSGHARGLESRNQTFDPNDLVEQTLRGMDNPHSGHARGLESKNQAYDPNDLVEQTLRGMDNVQAGHAKDVNVGMNYYDPNDTTRPTIKQETIYSERDGHVMSNNLKPNAFNPNDIPCSDIKRFNC